MSQVQWHNTEMLRREQFRYPDLLQDSVVSALDHLSISLNAVPIILSDYRPGEQGWHGKGYAIDTTWPAIAPLVVWQKARDIGLFSGLGIYFNDAKVASFHLDTRTDRTPDDPALWGNFITHSIGPDGKERRNDNYTSADAVIDFIKKNTAPFTGAALTILGLLWLLMRAKK